MSTKLRDNISSIKCFLLTLFTRKSCRKVFISSRIIYITSSFLCFDLKVVVVFLEAPINHSKPETRITQETNKRIIYIALLAI